jgi:hypothetical protein
MPTDINYKELHVNSYVRYINTGTRGTVKDIKEENGKIWVILDNDLMYDPKMLEIVEHKEYIKSEINEEEIEKMLDDEKITDVDVDIETCGAG